MSKLVNRHQNHPIASFGLQIASKITFQLQNDRSRSSERVSNLFLDTMEIWFQKIFFTHFGLFGEEGSRKVPQIPSHLQITDTTSNDPRCQPKKGKSHSELELVSVRII